MDISLIPNQKRILDSTITVDCFDLDIKNCTHYFLSHFHSDHYKGLKKSFDFPVYCSVTTANLVKSKIQANAIGLEMYKNYDFKTFVVRLIEANHCPGAVCFIFLIENQYVFHTGDFRYNKVFHSFNIPFKAVYLDNTFENYLNFPTQKNAILKILENFDQKNKLCKQNISVLCCTYCIGKEKIFLSIAEYLNEKVQVTEDKYKLYQCYDSYTKNKINKDVLEIVEERRVVEKTAGFIRSFSKIESKNILKIKKSTVNNKSSILNKKKIKEFSEVNLQVVEYEINELDGIKSEGLENINTDLAPFDRITTEESLIKVIGINQLKNINEIASKIFADKIIVICGTGWNEGKSYKVYKRMDGKVIKKGIEIINFRYSEHSSSEEIKDFKSTIKSENIINTVTNY